MAGFDLIAGLRVVFFGLLLGLVLLLWLARDRHAAARESLSRWTYAFMVTAFLAIYLYQATWQLAGFARPRFLTFMRRYNPRAVNAARAQMRGPILDRHGRPLARSRPPALTREYPLAAAACHLTGYDDPVFGVSAVERALNDRLLGRTVATSTELSTFGQNLIDHSRVAGNAATLTVDGDLQRDAHRLLAGHRGAILLMDVRRGDILLLYSAPGFDPARLEPGIFDPANREAPLLNRALNGLYPPGSTFKILLALAAVEARFDVTLDCPAEGYVPAPGTRPIRDHDYYESRREKRVWKGHGRINLETAFRKSSNVYFAQLGVRLGAVRINSLIERCGFTRPVVLRLAQEATLQTSRCQAPELSAGKPGETAQVAIGQGRLLMTPMHLLMLTAAVAADGRPPRPRLQAEAPVEFHEPWFDADVAGEVRRLMREAVRAGTGRRADLPGVEVAGKTGTAQTPAGPDHAWFACLAPAPRPRLAMVVIVEHGGYGSSAAVPIAAEILQRASAKGYLGKAPDLRIPGGGAP